MQIVNHRELSHCAEIIRYFSFKRRVEEDLPINFNLVFDQQLKNIQSSLETARSENLNIEKILGVLEYFNDEYSLSKETPESLEAALVDFQDWVNANSNYIDTLLSAKIFEHPSA